MSIAIKVKLAIITLFLITISAFSQKNIDKSDFSQLDLNAYKVEKDVYNFFWYKNDSYYDSKIQKRNFIKGDTLPYFADYKTYKGLENYGIQFDSFDKRLHTIVENLLMYNLEVVIKSFNYNSQDNTIFIRGEVKGGRDFKHIAGWNQFTKTGRIGVDIFIGEKKDTVNTLYYDPTMAMSYEKNWDVKLKGNLINKPTVLDSFPGFYLNNYEHFKTDVNELKSFEIISKINKNSVLIFGLENCYSEIFEIGKLIFDSNAKKIERLKIYKHKKQVKNPEPYVAIVRDSKQVLYSDVNIEQELPWYYQSIEKAEQLIVNKQFAKANEEYIKFLEKDHYIFARDMQNAVRASILCRDYSTAIVWCEKLALKGVSLKYFDAQIFERLKSTKLWNPFVGKYPILTNKYKDGLNQNLINGLSDLVAMDQKDYVRQSKGEFDPSKLQATTQKVDDGLIKLIKKQGFPTEERIGIKIIQDTIIGTSNDYYVLINHSHQMQSNRVEEIKHIINESAGKFEYDIVRNNLSKFVNIGTCYMLYKGNLYLDKNCINQPQMLQKIIFANQNKYGFVIDGGDVSAFGYNPANEEEDTKFMNDGFNFIMKLTNDMYLSE